MDELCAKVTAATTWDEVAQLRAAPPQWFVPMIHHVDWAWREINHVALQLFSDGSSSRVISSEPYTSGGAGTAAGAQRVFVGLFFVLPTSTPVRGNSDAPVLAGGGGGGDATDYEVCLVETEISPAVVQQGRVKTVVDAAPAGRAWRMRRARLLPDSIISDLHFVFGEEEHGLEGPQTLAVHADTFGEKRPSLLATLTSPSAPSAPLS